MIERDSSPRDAATILEEESGRSRYVGRLTSLYVELARGNVTHIILHHPNPHKGTALTYGSHGPDLIRDDFPDFLPDGNPLLRR